MVRHSSLSPYPDAVCQAIPRLSSVALVTGAVIRDQESRQEPSIRDSAVSFRLLEEVGRGGMGVVYRAEQVYPKRIVALKIMKGELTDVYAHRRFKREIELLARLNHVGIAQLYSAGLLEGTTTAKTPFLAMEFVCGQPLVTYAEERCLSIEQRVRLFAKVCDILAYAHRQGIIHRDLKPSNILVDDREEPKILDFGLAAGMGDADNATSQLTIPGQMVGTLDYMSPEQAEGQIAHIDQQSDVYALGVVLYELLTARRPFDFTGQNLVEAIQAIKGRVPPPMSAVHHALRGDLDTIVQKAIAKEKSQRYSSVDALAEDLRRHLAHEPIRACKPSMPYVASRFVRRNRMFVTAVAAIILALGVGLIVAADQAIKARASEARALEHAQRADAQAQRADREAALAKQLTLKAQAAAIRLEVLLADDVLHGGDPLRAQQLYNDAREAALGETGSSALRAQIDVWGTGNDRVQLIQQWEGHSADIATLAISPDERWVVVAYHDGRIVMTDFLDKERRVETRFAKSIDGVSFSPNGQLVLFYAGADFQVWSPQKAARVDNGAFGAQRISAVALSDDTVFWATDRQELKALSLSDKASTPLQPFVPAAIRTMAYTPAGLIFVNQDYRLMRADFANHTLRECGGIPVKGDAKVAIAPDGKHVAVLTGSRLTVFETLGGTATGQLEHCSDHLGFGFTDSDGIFAPGIEGLSIGRYDLSGNLTHSIPTQGSVKAALSRNFALVAVPGGPLLLWSMLLTPNGQTPSPAPTHVPEMPSNTQVGMAPLPRAKR